MTEPLEDLDRLVLYLMKLDETHQAEKYEYDNEDIMNATHVFMHVIGNRHAHNLLKSGLNIKEASKRAEDMGQLLHDIVLRYTSVDTQTYYQELAKAQGFEVDKDGNIDFKNKKENSQ